MSMKEAQEKLAATETELTTTKDSLASTEQNLADTQTELQAQQQRGTEQADESARTVQGLEGEVARFREQLEQSQAGQIAKYDAFVNGFAEQDGAGQGGEGADDDEEGDDDQLAAIRTGVGKEAPDGRTAVAGAFSG